MKSVKILVGDALARLSKLPDDSVHCVVTSPPYWRLRDYGMDGQIGQELTPEEHVESLVDVFREVRRVLRGDGTLWLNYGDSYASGVLGPGAAGAKQSTNTGANLTSRKKAPPGLKTKDLVGMPWMVAFALRADGWYLRSDIIWHKSNPMPESVLDRPTRSHEHIFLLSKSLKYYYDGFSVREDSVGRDHHDLTGGRYSPPGQEHHTGSRKSKGRKVDGKRNRRDVWTLPTQPFKGAHFAVFPTKLVEPCIKAGTSEEGCCSYCGAPRERMLADPGHEVQAGWRASCEHIKGASVPCSVLDPFGGAGTVGLVANRLGRNSILIELNREYAEMAQKRISDDCKLVDVEIVP